MLEAKELWEWQYITSEHDRGYLEGVLDCDGSLYITKHKGIRNPVYRPVVRVVNTNVELIKEVYRIIGGGGVSPCPNRSNFMVKSQRELKELLHYYMNREDMWRVLPHLKLRIKDGQRQCLLLTMAILEETRRTKSKSDIEALDEIYLECKRLNLKGKGSAVRTEVI